MKQAAERSMSCRPSPAKQRRPARCDYGAGARAYIDFEQYWVRRTGDFGPAICNVKLFEELTDKFEQLHVLQKRTFAQGA
jgi:hypothetical protein